MDRTKEAGSIGEPLYLDVLSSLKDKNIEIVGGRYGLSSKNTSPSDIKSVYDSLESKPQNSFTIGINDDLTHLSLPKTDYKLSNNYEEFKIYGFGSDGMVSASKNMLTLLHESLGKYVEGYFEYDSKKSGGVTISHLRMGDKSINAPFYVTSPTLVVVTKDVYFERYDMLSGIKDNGILLINTIKNEKELNDYLSSSIKKEIISKNINVKIINAQRIAYENHLNGKISKIMEVNILNLLNVPNAKEMVVNSVKKAFMTKGEDVVNNNINAINASLNEIKDVKIIDSFVKEENEEKDIYTLINNRKGENLSTSEVKMFSNGGVKCGLSKYEKRDVSMFTPKWNIEKCIECGACNIVCPHSVIRPFITKDKSLGKPLLGNDEYNYFVGISNKDCTGCGLCVGVCPTKALTLETNVTPTDELFNTYENPSLYPKNTIKGVSLTKPLFEFSGACAGCGETPYIKLLTQIVGEKLVIANATGCSSIYGGCFPSTPYLVPWANSLFEDNAEFAYGIYTSYKQKRNRIKNIISNSINSYSEKEKDACLNLLLNFDNYEITNNFVKNMDDLTLPKELYDLKEYIPKKSVWAIGGDGWAYDIGYNGIDHILHSNENINILVLDTEVYSNTGGQASKSTKVGAVAEFADFGKKTSKKDLFKIAMCAPNVYVGSICLGANNVQAIKTLTEAENHNGPSIVICYCPCIEHGIKGGMCNSINEEKLAVECGYTLLMRYKDNKLYLDSKEPNFDKYEEFLNNEVRYNALKIKDNSLANKLLNIQINNAKERYNYYNKIKSAD